MHHCNYCGRDFLRDTTLAAHICEPRRRIESRDNIEVKLGYQLYLRYWGVLNRVSGSSRVRSIEDFEADSNYKICVKFGRYCQEACVVNADAFADYVVDRTLNAAPKGPKLKIDQWPTDGVYNQFLEGYMYREPAGHALTRAIETMQLRQEQDPGLATWQDYLRWGNPGKITNDIWRGSISGWVLYNCQEGRDLVFEKLNEDQLNMVITLIDPQRWSQTFQRLPSDREWARAMLVQAGFTGYDG